MRHYEIVALVHPDQSDQMEDIVARYRDAIERSGGVVHRYENWGRRKLAYPINKLHKAGYFLLNIECSIEVKNELENLFRFNDAIVRTLVVRMDRAVTENSPIKEKIIQQEQEDKIRREEESRERAEREAREAEAAKKQAEQEAATAEAQESGTQSDEVEVTDEPQSAEAGTAADADEEGVAESEKSESDESAKADAVADTQELETSEDNQADDADSEQDQHDLKSEDDSGTKK